MKRNLIFHVGILLIAVAIDSVSLPAKNCRPSRKRIDTHYESHSDKSAVCSTVNVDWENHGRLTYKNEIEDGARAVAIPDQCTTDYLIIGLGTSGAVIARYLSDNFRNGVVVLNRGESKVADPVINAGINQGITLGPDLKYTQKYSGSSHITDSKNGLFLTQAISSGKIWGGSSATNNNFLSTRASTDFNDALVAASGNSRWSYANLLPYYKFIESFLENGTWPVSPERGLNGPLFISQLVDPTTIDPTDPFINAFTTVTNTEIVNDLSVSSAPTGLSSLQAYIDENGNRSYAISAFLPPSILNPDGTAADGRKLRVISPAKVIRILFSGKKAIGVQYNDENGSCRKIFARKQVILAGGSPSSTKILLRSGVGPVADLTAAGIKVVVDNPNVGTNLKIQYGVMAVISGTIPDVFIDLGAMIDGSNSVIPNQFPNDGTRRFQVFFYPFNALSEGLQTALGIQNLPSYSIVGMILNPVSVGTIQLINKIEQQVAFNVYADDAGVDLNSAVALFNIFKSIADISGQVVYYPIPGDFADPALLQNDARAVLSSDDFTVQLAYAGGAPMGTSIANGVVDGNLKVFGAQNLMVADNSILPLEATGDGSWQAYSIGLVAANILGAQVP